MSNSDQERIRVSISPDEALELLGKLASDDEFRERFVADPKGVLATYHVEISDSLIPDPVELPSKEALNQLLRDFDAGQRLNIHPPHEALVYSWGMHIFFRQLSQEGQA